MQPATTLDSRDESLTEFVQQSHLKSQLAEVETLRAALKQRADDISALPQRILAAAFEM